MAVIASWHSPGCLPDTDEHPHTFDTMREAASFLLDEITRFWDEDYAAAGDCTCPPGSPCHMSEDCPDYADKGAADERWLPVHTALHIGPSEDATSWLATTGDNRLVFTIERTED